MKTLLMTDGNNDYSVETRAATEQGYWRIAKKEWPYAGMVNLKIKVYDNSTSGDPIIYEGKRVLYC